jgi:hypothetical protein
MPKNGSMASDSRTMMKKISVQHLTALVDVAFDDEELLS